MDEQLTSHFLCLFLSLLGLKHIRLYYEEGFILSPFIDDFCCMRV